MSAPILATKLYLPPPRPKVVLRPRLTARLAAGLHRKLTLISAPAGFGKTTLVSEWLAACERPAAWLSLDEGDNDLNQFLAYLVAALQTVAEHLGQGVLETLQSPPPVPTEPILIALVNELATLPNPLVLVLDDYHVIDAEPVDKALAFLLEHLPPQLHLIITTREDPRLPLARLRVRDQLTELRATDLRFTAEEATGFLNPVMGLDLSAQDIDALETRTEGWIAGLQLAALSMQGHKDASTFIHSFTGDHHFVVDYLVEEVLLQQPASIQAFLLHTSILDRLCGPLCDAVLGDLTDSGQTTLEYLERANLFVVPLDDHRQWYRYHPLFADALRARLTKEQPDEVDGLHRQASEWFEENGLRSDAIRHALSAADFERAAVLIELVWSVIRRSCFRSPTWLGWIKSLPDELVRPRPVLNVGYAWELLNFGELEAAEARMRDAERWLEPAAGANESPEAGAAEMVVVNEEEFPSLRASLANARALHAQALGDVPGIVKHARHALAVAAETDYYTRGIAGAMLGLASWSSGDLETAHRAISEGTASLQMAGNLLFETIGGYFLAEIEVAQGRLRQAETTYMKSLKLATAQGEPAPQGLANLWLGLSELSLERNDLEAAERYLLKSEALGEPAALPDWPCRLCLCKARIKQAQGDSGGALALLDEAERRYSSITIPDVRPISALKARRWVAQGRLTEAQAWARERGLSVDDELSYLREFEHLTLARLLIARYKSSREHSWHEVTEFLERLLDAARARGRIGSMIEILVQQALAHEAQGDIPAALEPLMHALKLAEPEGYLRLLIDEGAPMARLLSEAAARGVMPDYTKRLLAGFKAEKEKGEATVTASPAQPLSEPLSERELEVLRLIAQGLSNYEISKRLYRALSTVKGHNRNIFGKLQVQNRTEAVARARELGLL
ncbi:MAG: AAA family ATPase [Trueperaceae bacterium]|nr:MAG: AAA family ATPase [Trueperaceae bacterium]